ncbi:hypothetical protein Tdes44962_MAKER05154, partial [Teratosphaeria destructans]
ISVSPATSAPGSVPAYAEVRVLYANPTSPDDVPSPDHAARSTSPNSCFVTVMPPMTKVSKPRVPSKASPSA